MEPISQQRQPNSDPIRVQVNGTPNLNGLTRRAASAGKVAEVRRV
jgi:hypothetical protein